MEIRVEAASIDALAEMVTIAREIDHEEAYYQTGKPLEDAMWESYMGSHEVYAGYGDDRLTTIWGVGGSPLTGKGVPWLVASNLLEDKDYAVNFLRGSCYYVNMMKDGWDSLSNYVYVENTKAIRWLKVLGFVMKPPELVGPFDKPFHPFEWRRDDV